MFSNADGQERATTGEDGRYELCGLFSEQAIRVVARREGHASGRGATARSERCASICLVPGARAPRTSTVPAYVLKMSV